MRIAKNAVVSVFDKTDAIPFIDALRGDDWRVFTTSGTQAKYEEATGVRLATLQDLAKEQHGFGIGSGREMTAQLVSGAMSVRHCVQLACVNLRPPGVETVDRDGTKIVSLDQGGIGMINAANNSGALVVTNPNQYSGVIEQLQPDKPFDETLFLKLGEAAFDHILKYYETAKMLPTFSVSPWDA